MIGPSSPGEISQLYSGDINSTETQENRMGQLSGRTLLLY